MSSSHGVSLNNNIKLTLWNACPATNQYKNNLDHKLVKRLLLVSYTNVNTKQKDQGLQKNGFRE